MTHDPHTQEMLDMERLEADGASDFQNGLGRREFLEVLGAGLLVTATAPVALGQRGSFRGRGGGGGGPSTVAARLHIGKDGAITVMTGKVEVGQGSRAELTQAAAEELRVSPDRIQLIMADTGLTPDDGTTAGSKTTPSTVPSVRRGAAAAREILIDLACKRLQADRGSVDVADGVITHRATKRTVTYAELAAGDELTKGFAGPMPANVSVTAVKEWRVLGTSLPRPNRRDLVTGGHRFPSDIVRPNMLYGKVLRAPSYGATLGSIDLSEAKAMPGVVVLRDGEFVGCCAPSSRQAAQAVAALAKTATWKTSPQPSSTDLFAYLKQHAQQGGRGRAPAAEGSVEQALKGAAKTLKADYHISYIQHAPLEPRAAVAEWNDGKLTVWTGSQSPGGVRGQLAQAFGIPADRVRVVIPDTGGGFGGKHFGDAAVEAARLAKAAGRPVSLRWTREEEFTWAYFRPAALIEIQGGLDAKGRIVAWDFTDINAGASALASPYEIASKRDHSASSAPPLRQGSYRGLASTANNFARESFMDELAHAAAADPLAFRLAHLKDDRLRAVLEAAAKMFGWAERQGKPAAGVGIGLACGTEKGSFVAACAEVAVDRTQGQIKVRRVCEAFECGAILNPANLQSQVQGCIIMGLGGALSEEMRFENGKILNASFHGYRVPRFADVPLVEIDLLNRPDLPSAGAGETPIIAIAPAVANAVFHATGVRVRRMPIVDPALKS
jgi:isoquinoline 1-oxidoreductase subunit beta